MKYLLPLLLLITSCKDLTKPQTNDLPILTPEPAPSGSTPQPQPLAKGITISGGPWTATLTSEGWEKSTNLPVDTKVDLSLENKKTESLLLFNHVPFSCKTKEANCKSQYQLLEARDIGTYSSISYMKTVTLQNETWSLVESDDQNLKFWTWVSWKNNTGYTIVCGGPKTTLDECQTVVETIQPL